MLSASHVSKSLLGVQYATTQGWMYVSLKGSLTARGEMIAFDSNAKSIIYVRCLNGFLSKNRLKEVSCLRIQKSACKAVFLKPRGCSRVDERGVCKWWWAQAIYHTGQTECQSLSWLEFSSLSVNMKALVPTVTSNMVTAGHTGHAVSPSPSSLHIKPQLTKAARGAIMRYAPFNCVWSVTFSVFLCHVSTLRPVCKELTNAPDGLPPPCLWDTSCSGQHQSSVGSLGQQSGLCTHTQINTQPIERESSFYEVFRQLTASLRLFLVCCRRSGRQLILWW